MDSKSKIDSIVSNVGKVIIGKDDTIKLVVTAMIAGGHVLLEDAPGTGKTVLAKSLAKSIDISYNRIQFTPDLLPSDITGLNVYQMNKGEFVFNPGPVFCNILLADEINRATPRTQAGLLECMEERQVTLDGTTRKLSEPFFVIATQNPIETSGTFPLPEAQLDRFIMKLSVGMPDVDQEIAIMERFEKGTVSVLDNLSAVASAEDIMELRNQSMNVSVHKALKGYIANLVAATRSRDDILSGVSPRGTLALYRCAQVYAMSEGRDYVVPEDIKKLAVPVLAHRIVMTRGFGASSGAAAAIESILNQIPVPTEEFNK
ncbi:MAG: MoxR family ATPase [Butyrivibrio sp.]|nr:MoxR family ATPase [Butyrivibrio sp.]